MNSDSILYTYYRRMDDLAIILAAYFRGVLLALVVTIDVRALFLDDRHGAVVALKLCSCNNCTFFRVPYGDSIGLSVLWLHPRDRVEHDGAL